MAAGRRSPNQSVQGTQLSGNGNSQVFRVFPWVQKVAVIYGGANATKTLHGSVDADAAGATFAPIGQLTGTADGIIIIPEPIMYVVLIVTAWSAGDVDWQIGGRLRDVRKGPGFI